MGDDKTKLERREFTLSEFPFLKMRWRPLPCHEKPTAWIRTEKERKSA